MKTRLFENGSVGIKLDNVSDIMKYHAINDTFSICNADEDYFEDYVIETDDDGVETEREPKDDEVLQRVLKAFDEGQELYATFWLDCGKVVDSKHTTLQSDFYVGQEVYIMQDNKICTKYIFRIMLGKVVDYDSCQDHTKIDKCEMSHYKGNVYWLASKRYYEGCSRMRCTCYERMDVCKEGEFFATKEDLVKRLMEE